MSVEVDEIVRNLQGSLHEQFPLLGLARAFHRNKRGEAITFERFPFLIPLYVMVSTLPGADFSKATQAGITELLIALMLEKAGWEGRIAAYVLPQQPAANRFVDVRINPLLASVPAYAERTPGEAWGAHDATSKGSLRRKRFGNQGSLLFLGSNTAADFVEFSTDLAIVDEYDLCHVPNVAKITDRTRESRWPQIFHVGNPELAGAGIERRWTDGSRARWYHRCSSCNERQALDWDAFVERNDAGTWLLRDRERATIGDPRPICRRCRKPFERGKGGVWIAEEPGRRPSFHVSRLDILPGLGDYEPIRTYFAEWVAAQGDIRKLVAFHVGVLGKSFESSGTRITGDMILRCASGDPLDDAGDPATYARQRVVAGVDVGSVLHVTVSVLDDIDGEYRRRGRWMGTVREFEEVDAIIERYSVDALVIDALPETRMSKLLRDRWRPRREECDVWLALFARSPKVGTGELDVRLDYQERVVSVDRTQLLDTTHSEWARGTRVIPSDHGVVPGFVDQIKASVRLLDPRGERYVWDEQGQPDHFRLADAYERLAVEIVDRGGGVYEV